LTERAGFHIDQSHRVTAADLEAMHSAAEEEGFQQGQKQGYEEGLKLARQEMQQQVNIEIAQITQLFQAFQQPYHDMKQDLIQEIRQLVVEVSRTFLEHELKDDHLIDHLVQNAVTQLLPSEYELVIHANPAHQTTLAAAIKDQLHPAGFRVEYNAKLSVGNVLVETGHSQVNINTQAMLDNYLESIKE